MVGHERQHELRPALTPPRLSIKRLMLITAACCVLFAAYRGLGAYGMLVVAFLAASIAAHVFGNSLGVRLREHGNQPQSPAVAVTRAASPIAPQHFAPSTRLREKRRVELRVYLASLIGAVVCGLGGVVLFATLYWHQAGWSVFLAGGLAFSVLGGMITFLVACFVGETWHAWHQARHHR